MFFERPQNVQLFFAQMFLHPRSDHPSHAVMVTQRTAVFLNVVDNTPLEFPKLFGIFHMRNKDKIEIGPLRVKVRSVCHAHGLRPVLDIRAHALMQTVEIVPGHGSFQRIDQDVVIAKVFAHIRFGIPGVLPFFCRVTGQRYRPVFFRNRFDFAHHKLRIIAIALGISQTQTALHGLESLHHEDFIHKIRHAVEFQPPVGLLRIGNPVNCRLAEFRLHDFPAGIYRGLPRRIHKTETPAILRHVAENFHGDFHQNTE
ncbi:MAG: hypothetical protein BWX55_00831 [Deltaproteobacteria bacterium ADurb.Bin022]|nr:MAG: hypothetical protein BWX55_00831 [Deltaproteobacteria bacterium ADurb.Bin022]